MNRWDELITAPRAAALRTLLCQAAATAHAENAERFAPDDLGDDARTYGICTSNSARFLAARAIEDADLDGVAVCERGMVWWLEIERGEKATVQVYFYKAPPGASTVWDLRLDDAEVKRQFSKSNGHQLQLFNRNGRAGQQAELLNLIVVHYGDPHDGFQKVDVGAPYTRKDELAWDWHEPFDRAEVKADPGQADQPDQPGDDGGGFEGLKLIDPVASADDDVAEDAQDAQAADFDGLRMREEPSDEDVETREMGEESS